MAFVVKFKPAGFTAAKYQETIKQLVAAGAGTPLDPGHPDVQQIHGIIIG
jgi:hypothetical protein